jgi:ABC-type proline/glycine betaine transport system ATPase subunit
MGRFWGMIRFERVTKRYGTGTAGETTAVDDLTLEAPTGRITVLVGPSGCGKTTTLRMVNRMITPTSGTITIDGRDTADLDVAELRRSIGYVIQHAGLFPHRTVLDNVTTVPRLLGTDKRSARARGMELMERVGLPPSPSATRRSSRVASSSGSGSPGRSPRTHPSCSWTSLSPPSTQSCASSCRTTFSASSRTSARPSSS